MQIKDSVYVTDSKINHMFCFVCILSYKSTHISIVPLLVRMNSPFLNILPVFNNIVSLPLLLSYCISYFKQKLMVDKLSCRKCSLHLGFSTSGWHSNASISTADTLLCAIITIGSLLDANVWLDSTDLTWTIPWMTSWWGVIYLRLASPEQERFNLGSWLSNTVCNTFISGKRS